VFICGRKELTEIAAEKKILQSFPVRFVRREAISFDFISVIAHTV
jgi:hypothetical protein